MQFYAVLSLVLSGFLKHVKKNQYLSFTVFKNNADNLMLPLNNSVKLKHNKMKRK